MPKNPHPISPAPPNRVVFQQVPRKAVRFPDRRDRGPYVGQVGGGVTVIRRDVYEQCPVPRIVGWGQEDEAWSIAMHCLFGAPWRGDLDLVHFWHPPQRRMSRVIGSVEGQRLRKRFRDAQRDPALMRQLVKEAQCDPTTS